MAKGDQEVSVGVNTNIMYKINDSGITDADVNKPVKLLSSSLVALCSNGDNIYGFINSVEVGTQDGKTIIGVQVDGRKWVTLDGASAVGTVVEAAANTAAGTALGANWGLVSVKTAVAADLATDASGTLIAASVNALLAAALNGNKEWKVIHGTGLNEADVLIELAI